MTEAVILENTGVRIGSREILKPLNAHIPSACLTSIIGSNGAGKTTLIKAVLGLIPYSGSIRFQRNRAQMRLGYIPQRLDTPADLPVSVLDFINLTLGTRALFLGTSKRNKILAAEALDSVGMKNILNRSLSTLSGGELQRVLLASALMRKCEILFLDEPAAGMDFAGEKRLHDVLKNIISEFSVSVVMVTHDLAAVHSLSKHVICLGEEVCEGPVETTLTKETLGKMFEESAWYAHSHSHPHGNKH